MTFSESLLVKGTPVILAPRRVACSIACS